ncbi:hypothetical protein RhiirA1_478032 [Rhizophagus irregularis]|uniref:Uncharacterized protein n=1 Tax=Rhizophagus irregularis TaxID=588596 RepID=A0A2N0QSN9_9GLOM|nr:hypothetical protein RhiirA1_478032 [Rhizophagus irregularis]
MRLKGRKILLLKNTGILPLDDTDSQDEIEENEHEKIEENECREIQNLIDKFEYTYPLTAKEYIRIDQENEIDGETPTKKQIVAILKENNSISDDESDSEITLISSSEVLAAFDKIFIYLEQIIVKILLIKIVDGIGNIYEVEIKAQK